MGSSQAFCRVVGKLFVEAEQFVVSEFFNVEVVEEFFNVKVVEDFFRIVVVNEFFNSEVMTTVDRSNIEVVDEFFNVKVVDEVFVFAAIRLLLRGCRPLHILQGFKAQDLSLCTYV